MRGTFSLISMALALLISSGCSGPSEKLALPTLALAQRTELQAWLDEHGASPEEYIAAKFDDHDIVFLGEYHRIRHDPLLVQSLIPVLHRNGVYYLALEFLLARDQAAIDSLLAGETYDKALANRLFWNQWPWWGYQEYVDILRAAWKFNHERPAGTRPLRVVGLNARMDWSHVWTAAERETPEVRKAVFPEGEPDQVMAESIRREILAKGEKALVYAGINHAFTRFRQPVVNAETGELLRLISSRVGNRIEGDIGRRAFTIFLHAPWPAATGYSDPEVYPADGFIDAFFRTIPPQERRVGFDLEGSPFGRLPATSSYWAHTDSAFRIEMFCDGWIYQAPLSQYEGVTVIPGWFNEENRLEAIAQIANPEPRVKHRQRTVEELMAALTSDTDFRRRFARFH